MKKSKTVDNPIRLAFKKQRDSRIRKRTKAYRNKRLARKKTKQLTTRQIIEQERKARNEYFDTALDHFDTRPFLKEWSDKSTITRDEVLDFAAKSYGTIEGFEMANRAMSGPLEMQDAGVDTNLVIEQAKKIIKFAFYELILNKSGMDQKWIDLSMSLYIAKDMGMEQTMQNTLLSAIEAAVSKPEAPFPVDPNSTMVKSKKIKPESLLERGRKRQQAYAVSRKTELIKDG